MVKSTTQAIKELIVPYLDEIIVFNKLTFIESKKFNNKDKSLYLIFGAYNNKLKQTQSVTYEPKTGIIQISLHTVFINSQANAK